MPPYIRAEPPDQFSGFTSISASENLLCLDIRASVHQHRTGGPVSGFTSVVRQEKVVMMIREKLHIAAHVKKTVRSAAVVNTNSQIVAS